MIPFLIEKKPQGSLSIGETGNSLQRGRLIPGLSGYESWQGDQTDVEVGLK